MDYIIRDTIVEHINEGHHEEMSRLESSRKMGARIDKDVKYKKF